ncbi:hypothetical protein HZ996_11960 [Cryomorphaceae bacterium]|nr:hypothetical protein HZ996_11960 [Cryomorphaceae bacterium]
MRNTHHWPKIVFEDIAPTLATLHQWIQIIGKIRLKTMPWQNHSWHTALYITHNGFSTHSIPYKGTTFQIDLDFKHHELLLQCAHTDVLRIKLEPMSVAHFYAQIMEKLEAIDLPVSIYARPNEMDPAIPFAENTDQSAYDPEAARTIWEAMLAANDVFNRFRTDFVGKASPVHLFWGAFDLAVTRFSGKSAPLHPGGMPNMPLEVMQEAYSQEVSSAGLWLGSPESPHPAFYAYSYPTADDFKDQPIEPEQAFWSDDMGEFFLTYEDVQSSENPDQTLYDFLQSTYLAAANTLGWDRSQLER